MPAKGELEEGGRGRQRETEYLFVVFKLLSSYALKAFQFQTKIHPTYNAMNANSIVRYAIGLSSIRFYIFNQKKETTLIL